MKYSLSSIQFKTIFLLTIFSLNMVVGFACAMGVDMGFNEHHHEAEVEFFVHTKGHPQHLEVVAHQHAHSDSDGKNNCCNDEVLKIVRADKVVPQVVKQLNPVFSTAFVITYPDTIILPASQVSKSNKYFVCGYHPPIPDIRVAIQSFQI